MDRFFSEENDATKGQKHLIVFGNNELIQGMACKDAYCDKISLYCVEIPNLRASYAYWKPWFSEEEEYANDSANMCDDNEYMTDIQCQNSYCDN